MSTTLVKCTKCHVSVTQYVTLKLNIRLLMQLMCALGCGEGVTV